MPRRRQSQPAHRDLRSRDIGRSLGIPATAPTQPESDAPLSRSERLPSTAPAVTPLSVSAQAASGMTGGSGHQPAERERVGPPLLGGRSRNPRDREEPSPELVRARVRRTALVPAILTVPCTVHGAPAHEPCYRLSDTGSAVCGPRIEACAERVKARIAKR